MSDGDKSQLVATDLPFTLYLNQRLTFDVLASLEDGFSSFSTVQTTSSGGTSTDVSGGAQLGLGNVFALLDVKLGGHGSRQEDKGQSETTTGDIVHTPASLFARLRKDLHSRQLVHELSPPIDFLKIQPGIFVEFEATLQRSPVVEMLTALSQLAPLIQMSETTAGQATSRGSQGQVRKGKQRRQEKDTAQDTETQINKILRAVTAEGSEDMIAEVGKMRLVLTTERRYFIDPSMNDIIDGTFRVFGKATRIIVDDSDGISLLRKTALGKFGRVVTELGMAMAKAQDSGFRGSLESQIDGPTMQVYPIAIFL